jgi:SAM-dependent methyltransferase
MNFFEATELDDGFRARMAEYDDFIRRQVGANFNYPLRMRDWELDRVLQQLPTRAGDYVMLDTGSFNTYLGLWLARVSRRVIVSDLFGVRWKKSLLRRLGLLPRKPTEAPFFVWRAVIRRAAANVEIRTIDLTQVPCADETFDFITSISVIEHIPAVEKALAEMYRCLKPGGRLLLTTDCSEAGKPYGEGVRYFTPAELEKLFARYPVTSQRRAPDFRRENWCYHKDQPLLTAFVEITKPAA